MIALVALVSGTHYEVEYENEHHFSASSLTADTIHNLLLTENKGNVVVQGDKIDHIQILKAMQ